MAHGEAGSFYSWRAPTVSVGGLGPSTVARAERNLAEMTGKSRLPRESCGARASSLLPRHCSATHAQVSSEEREEKKPTSHSELPKLQESPPQNRFRFGSEKRTSRRRDGNKSRQAKTVGFRNRRRRGRGGSLRNQETHCRRFRKKGRGWIFTGECVCMCVRMCARGDAT